MQNNKEDVPGVRGDVFNFIGLRFNFCLIPGITTLRNRVLLPASQTKIIASIG